MNEDRITGTGGRPAGETGAALGRHAANDSGADDAASAKGVVYHAIGTVQDGYGRARARVREMLDGTPGVRDVVATGRDYYHRGADAVTRSATDNTALTLFAAGVAVAAVSWLILGRRGGRDKA